MNQTTLNTLTAFPEQLEAHYAAIPESFINWAPESWDGAAPEQPEESAIPRDPLVFSS
jgi:hypothetical protein